VARRIGGSGGGSDPGPGKGAGRLVAAGAVALALAGGTTGAIGAGGTAAESGITADSVNGRNLDQRKNESKNSARNGKADEAWNRMGMRTLKKTVKQDLKCVAASTGRVRDFFLHTPCKSLDRILLAVGDTAGNSAIISVAWIGFTSRSHADAFERVETVQGSGDITPLAGALLDLADVHFTGHHYQARRDGATMVIAETESAAGHVGSEVLEALAEIAVWLPRL